MIAAQRAKILSTTHTPQHIPATVTIGHCRDCRFWGNNITRAEVVTRIQQEAGDPPKHLSVQGQRDLQEKQQKLVEGALEALRITDSNNIQGRCTRAGSLCFTDAEARSTRLYIWHTGGKELAAHVVVADDFGCILYENQ